MELLQNPLVSIPSSGIVLLLPTVATMLGHTQPVSGFHPV